MKTVSRVSAALAAAGISLAVASAAQAVTYDAFTSFDGVSSTSGAFSFGSFDPTTSAFTPFGAGNCNAYIGGTDCRGTLPGIYKTNSGAHQSGTVLVPADALILHPGDGVNGLLAGIVFTAPTTGIYQFHFSAAQSDTDPKTQSYNIGLNFGFGFNSYMSGLLTTSSPTFSLDGPGFFNAGEQVAFAIGNGGASYYNDSTAVNFSASTGAVPEAATWSMMLVGFSAVGGALRSRRKVAVSFG